MFTVLALVALAMLLKGAAAFPSNTPFIGGLALVVGAMVWSAHARARTGRELSARQSQAIADLDRARAAAEAAGLTKSRYLANVSHEIRSPLNAIYGYAQMIERAELADTGKAAAVIRRCAEHMTSLVESLLDISQIENGVLRLHIEPVRLDVFCEQVLRMVRPSAQAKGLFLSFQAEGRVPAMVRMDPNRLRQILLNLLFNAVKYTSAGHVTFRLRYRSETAIFEIIDTGPGIAEADQALVFEPFARGGASLTAGQPGAGLGLPIARALADMLGGHLELARSTAAGSCFRLTLMLPEVAETALRPAPSQYSGAGREILIVEDDPRQSDFLGQFLTTRGFAVTVAQSGEAGLEAAARKDFDAALLDISLPGCSGWDVAAALRQRHGAAMRIAMLSANAGDFYGSRPSAPDHDAFLMKPVHVDALIETLGGLLGLVPDAAPAAPRAPAPSARPLLALDARASGHAGRIREWLRIGYVRGIEQEIRALHEAPATRELADRLFACLDRLDLKRMAQLLDEAGA